MLGSTFQTRKGQLSLEFLLIFAIFLSAISIFLFSFAKIKTQTEASLDQILTNKIGNDLAYAINSLCILGDGNKREIGSNLVSDLVLVCNQETIFVSSNGQNSTYSVNCNAVCSNYSHKSSIKIENKNGTVFIS